MYYIRLLTVLFNLCYSYQLTLYQYPTSPVYQNSKQLISWIQSTQLNTVRIDLYQKYNYLQKLGTVSNYTDQFVWIVSKNTDIGSNYSIRITGLTFNNNTLFNSSPVFSIETNKSRIKLEYILGSISVIILLLYCSYYFGCTKTKAIEDIQIKTPFAATYPPENVHNNYLPNISYSTPQVNRRSEIIDYN